MCTDSIWRETVSVSLVESWPHSRTCLACSFLIIPLIQTCKVLLCNSLVRYSFMVFCTEPFCSCKGLVQNWQYNYFSKQFKTYQYFSYCNGNCALRRSCTRQTNSSEYLTLSIAADVVFLVSKSVQCFCTLLHAFERSFANLFCATAFSIMSCSKLILLNGVKTIFSGWNSFLLLVIF